MPPPDKNLIAIFELRKPSWFFQLSRWNNIVFDVQIYMVYNIANKHSKYLFNKGIKFRVLFYCFKENSKAWLYYKQNLLLSSQQNLSSSITPKPWEIQMKLLLETGMYITLFSKTYWSEKQIATFISLLNESFIPSPGQRFFFNYNKKIQRNKILLTQ